MLGETRAVIPVTIAFPAHSEDHTVVVIAYDDSLTGIRYAMLKDARLPNGESRLTRHLGNFAGHSASELARYRPERSSGIEFANEVR
jgi:hypothetical protein